MCRVEGITLCKHLFQIRKELIIIRAVHGIVWCVYMYAYRGSSLAEHFFFITKVSIIVTSITHNRNEFTIVFCATDSEGKRLIRGLL